MTSFRDAHRVPAAGPHATVHRSPVRLRILARPTDTLAGISPEHFEVRSTYDVRAHLACVYLARGWAEAVADEPVPPSR